MLSQEDFHGKHRDDGFDPIVNEDNFLYFTNMGGAGKIHCNLCELSQDIVSFLHGFGEDPWSYSGYQCQQCGMFHAIEHDMDNTAGKKCECGGQLERDKPLFCPKCGTKDVFYNMSYIT